MSGIHVSELSKRWGDVHAVHDVSFEVEPGTLTVLLGPSGCGKSTTLRLIAGLDDVSSGTIQIGGRDVTNAPPAEHGVAMVFQSYALFPHLSVRENIIFGLKVRRVDAAERDRRLKRASELLNLSELLDRRPNQLSGGQQQRVALGRAIVAEAPVCLMDEPLSNLDAKLRADMRVEIRALQQRLGLTMVYVTHDQVEAMTMADTIVVMNQGRIEQIASPRELYTRPATTFCARFIGTPPMNLIPSEHVHGHEELPPGSAIGVRAEDLHLDSAGVPATVESVEYLGADELITARIGAAKVVVRQPARADTPSGTVGLAWSPGVAHVFGPDGKRLEEAQGI
ncbi:ABC transporter ATP-binding protein [Pseudohoeflea coraliihabitans]|uniref:ABC transporter ATP-binding protein n=1 Tax=Pseudohoeflea coraliihabitans TaxID=2860393 RepID=A0ABS6WMK4_9HYPH|nr:ABC transporter ATP-binding protein [Pseudohoeflea sp. DP4N28-3]MBW3097181.1 ABC transporter ATP-binding protein [Pseudohoeflea sp. DP4N28-3]